MTQRVANCLVFVPRWRLLAYRSRMNRVAPDCLSVVQSRPYTLSPYGETGDILRMNNAKTWRKLRQDYKSKWGVNRHDLEPRHQKPYLSTLGRLDLASSISSHLNSSPKMSQPNITLYTTQTPNGIKISIALEELGYANDSNMPRHCVNR